MTLDNRTIDETMIQTAVEYTAGSKKNVILDATILTTLMSCPRLADFRFNHNLVSINGKSNSLECGSIIHVFMEYMNKAIIKGIKRSEAVNFGLSAAEMYIRGCIHCAGFIPTPEQPKPKCGHKPNEFEGVKNTPADSEGYKTGWKWVLETCAQYADFRKNDHWVPLEAEIVKKKIIYEDEEIRILWKSKLDLVSDTNQGIYPVDYKSMKQRRKNNSMNNQFMGQCFVMDTRSVFLEKIGLQTSLKPEEKFTRDTVAYSGERLIEWQSETVPYYAKLLLMYAETGHFPPNFSHCEGKYGDCAFYEDVCSGNPSMREENIRLHFIRGPEWNPTNDDEE